MNKQRTYSFDDAKEASLKYFRGDGIAADAYLSKYALKQNGDPNQILEPTPREMHKRLASEFARIERKFKNGLSEADLFSLMDGFKYIIPQGGSMMGIGNPLPISLSNCFVIGNRDDSYGSICMTDEEQVQLSKRRGGVGHDMSYIRPKGAHVNNAAVSSSGMVSFMERYSHSIREVAQNGRRGALMLSCSIRHPQAEDFIDAKMEEGKIVGANISVKITDDFMEAVRNNNSFIQQFPIDSEEPFIKKEISASKLWKKLMHNAWKSAEPGILFWDTIINESTARLYGKQYEEMSTNPCITAETKVYVADGRGYVSMKQLVDEGKDVPVFCINDKDGISVRVMRNPRLTGKQKNILKITLENGHVIRCTENHKFLTSDNEYVMACNLKPGSLLSLITKSKNTFDTVLGFPLNSKSNLYWTIGYKNKLQFEHRLIAGHFYGYTKEKRVTHHIDGNSLNNWWENLDVISKKEHDAHHAHEMVGKLNPIFKIKADHEKFKAYSKKMSVSTSGEKNGRYRDDITNEILKAAGIELCKKLNRGFSIKEYQRYIHETLNFTCQAYRRKELFIPSFEAFVRECIEESGIINKDWYYHSFVLKSYSKAINQGYETIIRNGCTFVKKICEHCGNEFWVPYTCREISFCTQLCAAKHNNNKLFLSKIEKIKNNQLQIYTILKYELGREPSYDEWVYKCNETCCSTKLGKAGYYASYEDIIENGNLYNHRIISIEKDGVEDVYNGTVDDFHNFIIGGFDEIINDKEMEIGFINKQCGEIPMSSYSSCILIAMNLYSYVKNPFTSDAHFDFELFKHHAHIAQRMADDIIELECEKIQQIINKINTDPENDDIKRTELNLWFKILTNHQNTRRTGLGITALGDMLAALGMKYGTPEATSFAGLVQHTLAVEAYTSSVQLAKERGSFPIWDWEKERYSPFLNRIINDMTPETYRDYMRYGRRNIHCLTIAPTGTVSLMTQTTSGIECVFMPVYVRRRKVEEGQKFDFQDEVGDRFVEYTVCHHKLVEWYRITHNPDKTYEWCQEYLQSLPVKEVMELVEQSPYHGATTRDVDWVEKVRMQGAMQQYVDHSISVTVNLPKEATEELVSKVYMTAWESGCKGCTIYRDGSRSGVLVAKEDKKEQKTNLLPSGTLSKRKPVLNALVDVVKSRGETFAIIIGIDDNMPYEVFAFKLKKEEIPLFKKNKQTTVTKIRKKVYSLGSEFTGVEGADNILTRFGSEEEQAITRMVSTMLRGGRIPLVEIIDQIIKSSTSIEKFSKVLAVCLQKFLKDDIILHEKCPNCGGDMISYEGCKKCVKCGQSKCG